MANANIHGFNVEYDDDGHTVKNAVHYLSDKLDSSEAKVFFDSARHDTVNHRSHFQVRDSETGHNHDLTLIYHDDGSYELRKRLIE